MSIMLPGALRAVGSGLGPYASVLRKLLLLNSLGVGYADALAAAERRFLTVQARISLHIPCNKSFRVYAEGLGRS